MAVSDHRSIANMVEVMIRDYCGRVGVPVQGKQAPHLEIEHKPKPHK
jgi:hypothetical protein